MAKDTAPRMPPVYIASVEAEEEGGFSVSFPDLEGCFTQGETFEDAVRYAAEAAAQWLEANGSYPEPSDPRAVTRAIVSSGGIPAAIEVQALKAKIVPRPGVTTTAPAFTARQGQYLAFIHSYTLMYGRPPAEAEMQRFFRVTPPSVHQMVLTLERAGLIRRRPGMARSIELLVSADALPPLRPGHEQSAGR